MSKLAVQTPALPTSPSSRSRLGEVRLPLRHGTVREAPDFNAERDAGCVRRALKAGLGVDKKTISAILCGRSNRQRQLLKRRYKLLCEHYLVKDLLNELHGLHKDVCVGLVTTPNELDAREIRRVLKDPRRSGEGILIEILASRSNAQVAGIKSDYRAIFQRDLVKDIEAESSFHFKKLLRALSEGNRDESGRVDAAKGRRDAAVLFGAGELRLGADEGRFNSIMATQGFPQLQLVFEEYAKLAKGDIEVAIWREFSGSALEGLLAVVKCAKHTPSFFAERIYLALKSSGRKKKNLVRLVVSRCEVDMVQIKEAYLGRFGKSLEESVEADTSGDYRDALLYLVKGNSK